MNLFKRKKIISFFSIFIIIFILIITRHFYFKKIYQHPITGTICSKEVEIYSLESGKIQKIFFDENDLIKKNDLLIQFDSSLIDKKINQIQATIEYEKTKQNLLKFDEEKILEEYLNCKKDNNNDQKGINSKLKILESLQLQRTIQQKKICKLETELYFQEERKKNLSIYSPCNGRIQNITVNTDQNIRSKDKLLTISDSDKIWLSAKIRNNKSLKYKIGDDFSIFIEEIPDSKFQGKIFFISNLEKNNRHQFVDIKLSINQLKMKPNEATHLLTNGMKAQFKYE